MLLFLILLFFGSRLTPYLCLLKWCFCFNLFFTLSFLPGRTLPPGVLIYVGYEYTRFRFALRSSSEGI